MSVIHGNENNFKELISQDAVLVDFFATWCGPCKMLGPVLEEMANDRTDIKIIKIDIDENLEIAKQFGVMSVPTLYIFKNGEPVANKTGYMPKEMLTEWISENI